MASKFEDIQELRPVRRGRRGSADAGDRCSRKLAAWSEYGEMCRLTSCGCVLGLVSRVESIGGGYWWGSPRTQTQQRAKIRKRRVKALS